MTSPASTRLEAVDAPASCSDAARSAGVRPSGTAGTADVFVFVEMPPPWPARIEEAEWLAHAHGDAETASTGRRVVEVRACRPVDAPPHPERRHVLAYERRPDEPRRLIGRRSLVATDDVPMLLAALRRRGLDALDGGAGNVTPAAAARDVFVCTHGSRDRCCGRRGAALVRTLARWSATRRHTSVWQTSHLGGHRMSPTLVDLPAGACWAYMDDDVAIPILEGRVDPGDVARRHRGSWTLGTAAEQVVASAAWERLGWEPSRIVASRVDGRGPDGTGVRVVMRYVEGSHDASGDVGHGAEATIEAGVERRKVEQLLSCHKPPAHEETVALTWFRVRRSTGDANGRAPG